MKSGFARQCKGNTSCSSDRVGWVQGNFLFKETTMSDLSPITLHYGNEVLNKLRIADQLIDGIAITSDSGFEMSLWGWLTVTVYESSDVYIEVFTPYMGETSNIRKLLKVSEALKSHKAYWSFTEDTLGGTLMMIVKNYSIDTDLEEQLDELMRPMYVMKPQD
jgi:hypothetical protein